MARIFGITLAPGVDIIYNKAIKMYDLAVACNVGRNPNLMTRARKYNLKQASKLFQCAYAWESLTQPQKDAWYTAADITGMNGYALWTQDKIYRLQNGIGGNANPSIYHQYKIGHIQINSPEENARIEYNKIVPYSLPCTIRLAYRCEMEATTIAPITALKFITTRFYSGQNIEDVDQIDLMPDGIWQNDQILIPIRPGHLVNWKIQIDLQNVQGNLYFDNLEVEYLATIQNDDPQQDEFPRYWQQIIGGDNVICESIYCPDAIN